MKVETSETREIERELKAYINIQEKKYICIYNIFIYVFVKQMCKKVCVRWPGLSSDIYCDSVNLRQCRSRIDTKFYVYLFFFYNFNDYFKESIKNLIKNAAGYGFFFLLYYFLSSKIVKVVL